MTNDDANLRHLIAPAVATVIAVASCLWGCASVPVTPPPAPPAPPAPQATLAIVALDDATGQPVAGARLDVQYTASEDDGRTNADGYVALLATVGPSFVVEVQAEGYRPWDAVVSLVGNHQVVARLVRAGPAGAVRPMVGRLRVQSGVSFVDDTGGVLPLYAHAGNLFSLYTRDPDRARAELDAIARAGYHGLRTWSTLGGDWWAGKHVGDYITPDYPGQVRAFFSDVAARKLRLVWSQGDIGWMRDRRGTMALFAQIDNDVGGVIDFIDCGNEAYSTGGGGPELMAECVGYYQQAGGLALKTLTDAPIYNYPDPVPVFDAYSIPPADAFDIHSYRGGHWYDKRRHIWGYTYCGEGCPRLKVGIGSEPPGNGALVSVTENKHELDAEAVSLLALASMLGRQAYVWFSGEGVILDRGLDVEAGFLDVPRAVALLPADVMTLRTSHHSGDSWRGTRVLAAQSEVRIDGRMGDDGRFAYTIDGPSGSYRLRVERGFTGRLCHPGTAICEDVSRAAGDVLDVSFTRGRLLVGRLH